MPRTGVEREKNSESGVVQIALAPPAEDEAFLMNNVDLVGDGVTQLLDKFDCGNAILGDWSFPGNTDGPLPSFSSVFDLLESNSDGTGTTATDTSDHENKKRRQKKRNMSAEQKEKMLERQRRYRRRKQQSISEMTKSLEERRKEIEYLKSRNTELGHRAHALEKVIDYATETLASCSRKEGTREHQNCLDEVDEKVQYLIHVFDQAIYKMTVPNEETVNNVIRTVQLRNVWRKDIAMAKLQQRVSGMMMRWVLNSDERVKVENEIVVLMNTRFKIAEKMIHLAPDFVMDRLADGWVGQSFNEGLLMNNPVRVDDAAVKVLKESIQVTESQQMELNRIWEDFCHVWNGIVSSLRLKVFQANGLADGMRDRTKGYEYPGFHHGMLNLMMDGESLSTMIQMNREQIRALVSLARQLVGALQPLQFGKILTFLPGHGPNMMYLSKVLSENKIDMTDSGHIVC